MQRVSLLLVLLACDQRVSGPAVPPGQIIAHPTLAQALNTQPITNNSINLTNINSTIVIDTNGTNAPPPTCASTCIPANPCETTSCACTDVSCCVRNPIAGTVCGTTCCENGPTAGTGTCALSPNTCGALQCPPGLMQCGNDCKECCDTADCGGKECRRTCSGGVCVASDQGVVCGGTDPCGSSTYSTCNAGTCTPGAPPIVCAGATACRAAEVCVGNQQTCVPGEPFPAGQSCGGDSCTPNMGQCDGAGRCVSNSPNDCAARAPQCQQGSCDAASGTCLNSPKAGACTLADKCKVNTQCVAGACVGEDKVCPSPGPCQVGVCDPATGECTLSAPKCEVTAQCMVPSCDEKTGACSAEPTKDGTSCDNPECTGGLCIEGDCACPAEFELRLAAQKKKGCAGSSAVPMGTSGLFTALVLLLRRRQRQG